MVRFSSGAPNTEKTIKALRLYCFEVFGTPDEKRSTSFDIASQKKQYRNIRCSCTKPESFGLGSQKQEQIGFDIFNELQTAARKVELQVLDCGGMFKD